MRKLIIEVVFSLGLLASAELEGQQTDPFMVDWVGKWVAEGSSAEQTLVAQVIRGSGTTYQINFLAEFDMRGEPFLQTEGKRVETQLVFEEGAWSGTIDGAAFWGKAILKEKEGDFELKKVTRLSPNLGADAPEGAIVLFDGSDLSEWLGDNQGTERPIPWTNESEVMTIVPARTRAERVDIMTKRQFRDFHLHLEFKLPLLAEETGQKRSNSGVIIRDYHFIEIQILDSYGLPGYWNECGGVYRTAAPKINMCAPPLQWQSYDIYYTAPRFDWNGNILENPRLSVDHNGVLIHNELEIPYSDSAVQKMRENPGRLKPGQIMLQDHTNVIHFRNIWIVENQ